MGKKYLLEDVKKLLRDVSRTADLALTSYDGVEDQYVDGTLVELDITTLDDVIYYFRKDVRWTK